MSVKTAVFQRWQVIPMKTSGYRNSKDMSHTCETCLKVFDYEESLVMHWKVIHERQKSYKCDICSMIFSNLPALQRHVSVHTREEAYECDTCGKNLLKYSDYIHHIMVHADEKPHTCDVKTHQETKLIKRIKETLVSSLGSFMVNLN
ncbi:zinc finger protein 83-like [Centruroides vittatus]|uniref:zinc finger protein 83-like n=1 Tax=Centruroides vittatus TaxID=120091 RepID=UPI0035105C6F